ncbi:DUF6188 family protein [Kribbella sp. NPDC026596]|uniref:DUF6188 family protein n=1 Tax=Kribbella sp. NPDC026596 TaxID=3155122 RepID=UPI0034038795
MARSASRCGGSRPGHRLQRRHLFGRAVAVTIDSPASLGVSSSQRQTDAISRNRDGSISASKALMSLQGQRVVSGVGFKTGTLRIVFDSGTFLTAPYNEAFEAWHLNGPSGRVWVSLPGGGLATHPQARA